MDGCCSGFGATTWFVNIDTDHPKNVFEIDPSTKSWRRIWDNDTCEWRKLTEYENLLPNKFNTMNMKIGKFVIKQKNGKYYDGDPSYEGAENIQNAWIFNEEQEANRQCYDGEVVENLNKNTTTIDFAHDFKDGENIVFIAVKGTPESILRELSRISTDASCYGKPHQGIIVKSDSTSQVITPNWKY